MEKNSFYTYKNLQKLRRYHNIFIKIIIIILIYDNLPKNNIYIDNEFNTKEYINHNFSNIMKKINKNNFNYSFKKKNSKIANIFILLSIIPFIKRKIIIKQKKNKEIYQFFKSIFRNKTNKNNILIISKEDYYYINEKFNELINYKWEIIPKTEEINFLRYIINNYYDEKCLEIFDKALNLNFKYYIKNQKKLSFNIINKLMSKNIFNNFYRK